MSVRFNFISLFIKSCLWLKLSRLELIILYEHNSLNLYINLARLSVCLYPIKVKTAEPIWLNFFVETRVTPEKVYELSNFQKFASIKIRFLKILKIHEFFLKILEIFFFVIWRTPVYFISNKNFYK